MTRAQRIAPFGALAFVVLLVAVAMVVPAVADWDVHVNHFPPLHADWDPRLGPGTLPALLVGGLAIGWSVPLAERLRWRTLVLAAYAGGVAWMLSLAFVDGRNGVARILDTDYEYLRTARATTDFHGILAGWVARIPYDGLPDDLPNANWPVHVAGHPPGALGFFVLLDRIGLGSGWWAGVVVTLAAATTALAVMVTLRVLGAEVVARRAAPFLVFGPASIWQCVSADGVFAAVGAWGIAALGLAAVRRRIAWSVLSGLLLGGAVMMSYGLPLLGLLAVAVLVVARTWRPLPWSVLAALGVVAAFGAYGFWWWEALPALHDRYWAGVARNRPASYWMWGNVAALTLSAGPMLWVGLTALGRTALDVGLDAARVVRWLVGAACAMVLLADVSQLSKAEVERIWLPFVPWLLVASALLPERWRRAGIAIQVVLALVVQHLLATGW
jgi:hypothetical protein